MSLTAVEAVLLDLVVLFALAGTIAAFAVRFAHIPYTIALLLVGLAVSLLDVQFATSPSSELLSELILSVLVPALVFQGASRIDVDQFVANVVPILVLAVVGLLASVVLLGVAGTLVYGFPLVVALLFAAIVLPTDPVAVLPIFEGLGAPERLSVMIDGESMLNDGVGVVIYTSLIGVALEGLERGASPGTFLSPGVFFVDLGVDIVVATAGGLLVGVLAGYVVSRVAALFDDGMTTLILSFVLVYGVYLLGEELGASGVVAVVGAGLFTAERRETSTVASATRLTFRTTWSAIAFVANTFLFLVVGIRTPFDDLLTYMVPTALAVLLVFLARAVVVYPLAELLNRGPFEPIPRSFQHVFVWSGIHVSIPLALVLGLPPEFPAGLAEQLRTMVFGVAAFTLVVQGLSMAPLVDRLGLVSESAFD